jgi:hypothetical protein
LWALRLDGGDSGQVAKDTKTMQVRLKPVYSKLAIPANSRHWGSAKLPVSADGTSLAAVTTSGGYISSTDCSRRAGCGIFNTAMTGDGKSLAGQLPSLVNGWRRKLFAMYPTNELIRDQLKQAQQTWLLWQQSRTLRRLTAARWIGVWNHKIWSTRGGPAVSIQQL